MERSGTAIVWFRSDLRLDDNPAWAAATRDHARVVALFVLDRRLLNRAGPKRRDLFCAHLAALDQTLRSLGGRLVIREADPGLPPAEAAATEVRRAADEVGAGTVHANRDVGRFARRRDDLVDIVGWWGRTVHPPGSVLTNKGTLSRVFTPFYRRWDSTVPEDWPQPGGADLIALDGVDPPTPDADPPMAGGEGAALDRLAEWLSAVDAYEDTRNLPAIPGTSMLSADLKFGTIAARRIVLEAGTGTEGRAAFVRQLAWRDWYTHLMWEMPHMVDHSVRPEYDRIEWQDDPDDFAAWCAGRTGYPIVDAGMRQLVESGWMHNRVRMICASFLVKDLLVDWRKGERFFRHHLIDSDLAQNVGNWQWVAGTGPDSAPYFRIMNPTAQQQRWDPDGTYVNTWLDADDPAYPGPIVEHGAARDRTLAAYKAVKGS